MKKPSFDNVWVVRAVSLLFAVFLYIFVTSSNAQPFLSADNQQFASVDSSETISNVPVFLGEHDDDLYISGLPDTVNIRLTGPRNLISQLTIDNFRVETESLLDLPTGTQAIRLVAAGLPEDIHYEISPSQVIVRLSRKATITVPVEYEIMDGAIANGYEVTQVTMNPSEVELTGDSSKIEKVDRALVRIASEEAITESFSALLRLQILDENDNLLDINTPTAEIQVAVTVESQSVSVPLRINPQGEDLEKYSYEYSFVDTSHVDVYASPDIASNIDWLGVGVDVTGLTETAVISGVLSIPENIEFISQNEVAVLVEVYPVDRQRISPVQSFTPMESESIDSHSLDANNVDETSEILDENSSETEASSEEPSE